MFFFLCPLHFSGLAGYCIINIYRAQLPRTSEKINKKSHLLFVVTRTPTHLHPSLSLITFSQQLVGDPTVMQHTSYIPYIQGIFFSLYILKIKTERKGRCDTAIFSVFLKVNCRDCISQKCPVSVVSVFKNLGPFRCHCFMAVCRKCNHRIVVLVAIKSQRFNQYIVFDYLIFWRVMVWIYIPHLLFFLFLSSF